MKTINISEETYEKIKDQLKGEEVKPIESMEDLVGQIYTFQCVRYIYHGEVKVVNSDYVTLTNASVVFDTGSYDNSEAEDMQKLPNDVHVMRGAIEHFTKMKW